VILCHRLQQKHLEGNSFRILAFFFLKYLILVERSMCKDIFNFYLHQNQLRYPSRKLTWHWKIRVEITSFSRGYSWFSWKIHHEWRCISYKQMGILSVFPGVFVTDNFQAWCSFGAWRDSWAKPSQTGALGRSRVFRPRKWRNVPPKRDHFKKERIEFQASFLRGHVSFFGE